MSDEKKKKMVRILINVVVRLDRNYDKTNHHCSIAGVLSILALVLHEYALNDRKHGVLDHQNGRPIFFSTIARPIPDADVKLSM
jgi:hypothetical protein